MQNPSLSIGQLHILEMMNRCRTDESLKMLKKVLFEFYAKEAEAEVTETEEEPAEEAPKTKSRSRSKGKGRSGGRRGRRKS